jgi:hypothetical protein
MPGPCAGTLVRGRVTTVSWASGRAATSGGSCRDERGEYRHRGIGRAQGGLMPRVDEQAQADDDTVIGFPVCARREAVIVHDEGRLAIALKVGPGGRSSAPSSLSRRSAAMA